MKRAVTVLVALLLLAAALPVFAGGGQEAQKEIVLQWPCIWVAKDSKAATVEALVNQFNADNAGKIRVVIEPNPDYDGYRDKINTMMAAGQVPDLFIFNPDPTSFTYYQGDLLMDFSDDLKGEWGKDFVEGTIAASTRNGRTKSIPYELGLTPIWYNSALFAKAGIKEFPKTFDEFWAACDKLKAAGIVPTSQMTGGSNAWTSMLWYSHILASIGGPEVWSRPLSDPMYVKAAEILLRLYAGGNTTKDAVGGDAAVSGGHYLAGRTAIFINGPWYIGRLRGDAPEVYKATNVAPAPAVAGSLFCVKLQFAPDEAVDPLQKKFMEASANAAFVVSHFQANYKTEVVAEFGQALGAMVLGKATPAEFVQKLQAVNK